MTASTKAVATVLLLGAMACGSDKESSLAEGAQVISKDDLANMLTGNTLVGHLAKYGLEHTAFFEPGGVVAGQIDGSASGVILGEVPSTSMGTWRLNDRGQVCVIWDAEAWNRGDRCRDYLVKDREVRVFSNDGDLVLTAHVEQGNSLEVASERDPK